MKRRSFMGGLAAVLGGGSSAGATAASAAMSLPTPLPTAGLGWGSGEVGGRFQNDPLEHAQFLRRQLRRIQALKKERPEWWVEQNTFPYDDRSHNIEALRSVSAGWKQMKQQERYIRLRMEREERSLTTQIAQHLWENGPGRILDDLPL